MAARVPIYRNVLIDAGARQSSLRRVLLGSAGTLGHTSLQRFVLPLLGTKFQLVCVRVIAAWLELASVVFL